MRTESCTPCELLEVYAKEREIGLTAEGLQSWLHRRAQAHYQAASERERPHCKMVMGAQTQNAKSQPGVWPW